MVRISHKKGFTLVELSIVLVIIGLLIGGILVARSMISTAKIQSTIRELQQYEVAIHNFKTTFQKMPGDDPFYDPPGNGDGSYGYIEANNFSTCTSYTGVDGMTYVNDEMTYLFSHLYQAGMIKTEFKKYYPSSCNFPGGVDDKSISFPWVEVRSEIADNLTANYYLAQVTGTKSAYYLMDNVFNPGIVEIDLFTNPEDAPALAAKLGRGGDNGSDPSVLNPGTAPGFGFNGGSTTGCRDIDGNDVDCGNPAALAGWSFYVIEP